MGLGQSHYISLYNCINIPFELERIVDEEGNQIQATSHVWARPFNKEEFDKIKRINMCLGCHQETPSLFWKKVEEKWGVVKDSKSHIDAMRDILRQAVGN
jgi:hypothetical protein